MYTLKTLTENMLSDKEAMVYLLVTSGNKEDFRAVGEQLGMSHEGARKLYERAKNKVKKFEEAGILNGKE